MSIPATRFRNNCYQIIIKLVIVSIAPVVPLCLQAQQRGVRAPISQFAQSAKGLPPSALAALESRPDHTAPMVRNQPAVTQLGNLRAGEQECAPESGLVRPDCQKIAPAMKPGVLVRNGEKKNLTEAERKALRQQVLDIERELRPEALRASR